VIGTVMHFIENAVAAELLLGALALGVLIWRIRPASPPGTEERDDRRWWSF
jgi:hypothetical protein